MWLDCWIDRVSYINFSTFRPLSGSFYVQLPVQLRSSKNGLVNIRNNDGKCFLWCHVRHINSVKMHPERFTQNHKKLVNDLNYDGLNFLCEKKILATLKQKTTFSLMCIVMKTSWLSNLRFISKIWKLDGFVPCN